LIAQRIPVFRQKTINIAAHLRFLPVWRLFLRGKVRKTLMVPFYGTGNPRRRIPPNASARVQSAIEFQ
jgi:hypothetical protein